MDADDVMHPERIERQLALWGGPGRRSRRHRDVHVVTTSRRWAFARPTAGLPSGGGAADGLLIHRPSRTGDCFGGIRMIRRSSAEDREL